MPYKLPLVGGAIAHMSSNDVTTAVQLAIAPYSCNHQAVQCTGQHLNCAAMPDIRSYCISGQSDFRMLASQEEKITLSGAPTNVSEFACVAAIAQGRLRTPVQKC